MPDNGPYYDDGTVTIYHGDCREILPTLRADAIVTDPPYGIGWKGGLGTTGHSKGHGRAETIIGDDEPFDPAVVLEAADGVALFGAQHFYAALPPGGTFHVWNKRGDYRPNGLADFDTVWINRKERGRIHRCVWRGLCRETEHNDPIQHPTQKPVRVMRWVLGMFPDAVVVVDPYMGSGSTLRAAKDLGRRAIGIEIEERYCEISARRCAQDVLAIAA